MNRTIVFCGSLLLFFSFAKPMNSATDLEALVKRQVAAWENQEVSALVADFAPEAVFIAADYTFTGKNAIAKAATDYFQNFKDTKVTIKRIILQDNLGAVEWDWRDRNRKNNEPSAAEDAIIFELNPEGKIIYWREYIQKI